MTSDSQITANRHNAQLSTGPRTPAGRDASRWNALRHGLRAELAVLPDEDPADYDAFQQALVDELQPAGELEAILVGRIVSLAWRLGRAGRVEAGLFRRNHFGRQVQRARETAKSHEESASEVIFAEMDRTTVTDEEAHRRALRKVEEAEALRDAASNSTSAAFQRDSTDTFSKLARYETSLERSFYKALHELQRLQAARTGGTVPAPAVLDVNVDTGQEVA